MVEFNSEELDLFSFHCFPLRKHFFAPEISKSSGILKRKANQVKLEKFIENFSGKKYSAKLLISGCLCFPGRKERENNPWMLRISSKICPKISPKK